MGRRSLGPQSASPLLAAALDMLLVSLKLFRRQKRLDNLGVACESRTEFNAGLLVDFPHFRMNPLKLRPYCSSLLFG